MSKCKLLDTYPKQGTNSGIKQKSPCASLAKKKAEDGIYFLKGKAAVCVNRKFYKI